MTARPPDDPRLGQRCPDPMLTARDAVEARIQGLDCAPTTTSSSRSISATAGALRAPVRRGRQPLLPERFIAGRSHRHAQSVRIRGADVLLTAKVHPPR